MNKYILTMLHKYIIIIYLLMYHSKKFKKYQLYLIYNNIKIFLINSLFRKSSIKKSLQISFNIR